MEFSCNIKNNPESNENDDSLEVYYNQVGGHTKFLKPTNSSDFIIKPANLKEIEFYENM